MVVSPSREINPRRQAPATSPIVSVIIPADNGGRFLVEAVQSVLDQTYPNFELIVVDDQSPEKVTDLLKDFTDPRLTCLVHETNQGAVAARHTGVRAASGDIIAFLDQDDLFHPEKLQAHVQFLQQHPDIGVTYNARFEIDAHTRAVRSIWQPPDIMTLGALLLGFPFSPSDTVLRRELAVRDEIWDQSYVHHDGEMIFNGAEIILGCRLALSGTGFANVGRVLNYRRYHPNRVFKGLSSRCRAERTCQDLILGDPRCPEDVTALRDEAFMNTYRIWAYYAFAQGETAAGQSFTREAVRLAPSISEADPCGLIGFMVDCCATDSSVELEEHSNKIVAQFPSEIRCSPASCRQPSHRDIREGHGRRSGSAAPKKATARWPGRAHWA